MRSYLRIVCLLSICVLLGAQSALAAPWNDDATDTACYSKLITVTQQFDQMKKYQPLTIDEFYQTELSLTAAQMAALRASGTLKQKVAAAVETNERDVVFGINFQKKELAVLGKEMGEIFGPNADLKLKDAFPYFAVAKSLPDNETFDNYRVMNFYFADSLDFMYCGALVQTIEKPNLTPKDITAQNIGMMLPPLPFEIEQLTIDGKKFKKVDILNRILDRTDGKLLLNSHWIFLFPESQHAGYNPYLQIDAYKKTVDAFNADPKIDHNNPNSIRIFDPIRNYRLLESMLKSGQEYAWRQSWLVANQEQFFNVLTKAPNATTDITIAKPVPLMTQTQYLLNVADELGEKKESVFAPIDKIREQHGIQDELTDAYVADVQHYLANPAGYDWQTRTPDANLNRGIIGFAGLVVVVLCGALLFRRKK